MVVVTLAALALSVLFGLPVPASQQSSSAVKAIARLQSASITESSGIVASRKNPGIYWTHNDSGDGPYLYAFNRDGRTFGRWRVRGATAIDWEDIAIFRETKTGAWILYIGDIGDNDRKRSGIVVWRVAEPVVSGPDACRKGCETAPATAIRLRYPDRAHNAETLLVHPQSGDLYVVSKAGGADRDTTVFVVRNRQIAAGRTTVLEELATLNVPDPLFARFAGGVTGGEISPDGRRVVLCYYFGIYEAELPANERDFDAIWDQQFRHTNIGFGLQIEGACYRADGKAILTTTEGSPTQLFEISLPAPPANHK